MADSDEKVLIEIEYDLEDANKGVDTLTDNIVELEKANKSLKDELKKGKKSQEEVNKQLALNNESLKKNKAERRDLIKIVKTEKNSLDGIKAAMAANVKQRNKLNLTTKKGRKEFSRLTNTIAKQENILKKFDKQIGRSQRFVGGYADGFKNLIAKLKGSKEPLKGVSSSLGNTTKAISGATLALGGVLAGLGLVIGGLKKLIDSGRETQNALASLSAITGATGEDLEFFKDTSRDLAVELKTTSVDIIKAFEAVGSARPELLKDKEALAQVTKQAVILSKATGGQLGLEEAAKATAGALNQFGIASLDANRVINVLAAGSKEGAAAIPLITQALDKFGTIAAASNVSIEQSVALTEVLAEKNIEGAEAGTQLKNVLLILQQDQKNYKDGLFDVNLALDNLNKDNLDAIGLTQRFGKENVVAAGILANSTTRFNELTEAVTGTNTALEQANIQTNTLDGQFEGLTARLTKIVAPIGDFLAAFLQQSIANTNAGIDQLTGFFEKTKDEIVLTQEEITAKQAEEEAKRLENAKKAEEERARILKEAQEKLLKEQAAAKKRADEKAFTEEIERLRAEQEAFGELELIDREEKFNLKKIGLAEETEAILELRQAQGAIAQRNFDDELLLEEEKKNRRINIARETFAAIQQISTDFFAFQNAERDAQEAKALQAAGEDEEKKEAIRKKFAKKRKKDAIKQALINTALAITSALATVIPLVPAGVAAAALAGISGGLQVAAIKKQTFGKGGRVPMAKNGANFGTFQGNSHSSGGIDLFTGEGRHVANVEGRENFYVLNKNASDYINSLSDINQRIGGGVPLTNKKSNFTMQDGGVADTEGQQANIEKTVNEAIQRTPIIVQVADISTGLNDRDNVLNAGVI